MQLATVSRRWRHGLTMDKPAPTAGRYAWLKDANSFLVSAVCHLVVLILLGMFTVAAGRGWHGIELLAQVSDDGELPGADVEPPTVQLEAVQTSAAAAAPEPLSALAPALVSSTSPIDSPLFSVADLAGAVGRGLGDAGDKLGSRVGESTEFFGLGGYGNTFVYVVDCSDSMNEDRKFDRARYELLQSIEQLGKDQRYFVIFYNDEAYPMNADKPVPATPDEFQRTRRWVSRASASGGTNPLPALLYALSLKPDAIYFLSDGRFNPTTIAQLRIQNRPHSRRVPIHTIAFVNRDTMSLMRTIARQSDGEFRFVP